MVEKNCTTWLSPPSLGTIFVVPLNQRGSLIRGSDIYFCFFILWLHFLFALYQQQIHFGTYIGLLGPATSRRRTLYYFISKDVLIIGSALGARNSAYYRMAGLDSNHLCTTRFFRSV